MNQNQRELSRLTRILLEQELDFGRLTSAIDDLYNLLVKTSGVQIQEHTEDIHLSHGKALGPHWAALCVREHLRTKRFIRGVYQGILEAKKRFPNTRIHLLYAGTGPFATLVLPMTTLFPPEELSFTLLEINTHSFNSLRSIIQAFEIESYVKEIVQCNACTYRAPMDHPIHMVVTETMQNALKSEPQVAITLNLVPQMEENGILIPENIRIQAGLLSFKLRMQQMLFEFGPKPTPYRMLKTIFELNKKNVSEYTPVTGNGFPVKTITIPQHLIEEFPELCLFTTIQVFGEEILSHYQCSLNLPLKILDLKQVPQLPRQISFQYQIDEKPKFVWEMVHTASSVV